MTEVLQSYSSFVVVTKSDTVRQVYKALFVVITGDVSVKNMAGTTITLVGVPAYTLLPFMVSQVLSASTTSTQILGLN